MPRLFSYCIPGDDGAAPNPYGPICTLNICKPVIRRVAEVGDWVVGTGSMQFGFENKVVYAMEITKKLSMEDYWHFCNDHLQDKIPNWKSKVYKERVGDCIYDFSTDPPKLLESVHDSGNVPTDLGGKFALLSDHFYYFGSSPEPLPLDLQAIVKQGQGHRSTSNQPYFHTFIEWISTQEKAKNKRFGVPHGELLSPDPADCRSRCSARNKMQDEMDELLGDEGAL